MKTRLSVTGSILLHSGARRDTGFRQSPYPRTGPNYFPEIHAQFLGSLWTLRRGFTKASTSTKKLPQLAQVKQGEELKPCLFLGLRKSSFNYWKGLCSTQTSIYELSLGARPTPSIYKHS